MIKFFKAVDKNLLFNKTEITFPISFILSALKVSFTGSFQIKIITQIPGKNKVDPVRMNALPSQIDMDPRLRLSCCQHEDPPDVQPTTTSTALAARALRLRRLTCLPILPSGDLCSPSEPAHSIKVRNLKQMLSTKFNFHRANVATILNFDYHLNQVPTPRTGGLKCQF
jgi:hypothetical protein